jgi:hypothetical protein
MNYRILAALLLLIACQNLAAKISISVDRNPIVMNKSFNLIFESDEKINSQPDFEPLKKLLTILNKNKKTKTHIINGSVIYLQHWILEVSPKSPGKLQIPPIKFDHELSQPHTIDVEENSFEFNSNQIDDVFINVAVNTLQPYVQAQIIYTVKLYRAITTNNADLKEPQISGGRVVIKPFYNDKSYEAVLNGKRYEVFERRYAIFPQSSGTLTIEPIIFQAQTSFDSFKYFEHFESKYDSILRQSKAIRLDVKSIPESYTGNTWLPAENITIQEQWSVAPEKLKQGEVVTRTLTLTADGLVTSNLPEITEKLPDRLKHYSDQPEFEEKNNTNGFTGIRHDKMAIIPMDGRDYILAGIKLPWWNTKTDKMEYAELPERTIHADSSVYMPDENTIPTQAETNSITSSAITDIREIGGIEKQGSMWKWVSLDLFFLWIITLFIFWMSKKKTGISDESSSEMSKRQKLKELKKACLSNDTATTKKALLDWARIMWPDETINNINSIKSFCDEELKLKLDELNTFLYGKNDKSWDGQALLTCFEAQSFDKN